MPRFVHVCSSLLMRHCTRGVSFDGIATASSLAALAPCSTSSSRRSSATLDSRSSWLCPHTLRPSMSEAIASLLVSMSASSFALSSSMRFEACVFSRARLDSQDLSADSSPAFSVLICCWKPLPSPNIAPVRTPSLASNASHRLENMTSMDSSRPRNQDSNGALSARPSFASSEAPHFERSSVIAGVATVEFNSLTFDKLDAELMPGWGGPAPGRTARAVRGSPWSLALRGQSIAEGETVPSRCGSLA
mmetsp:Transcript_81631/g.257462  ORF Transcript_81631/g.257462 Transcript_81631/m.257462 type:complete len:248 (+) Transcript_81631:682-1425(+)